MNHPKPAHNLSPRIGLFGGTFNPIHIGHLEVAEDVRQHAISEKTGVLAHPEKKSIYLVSVPSVAIASTQIRDMIRAGQPIHHWIGPGVSDYIENKGLYR